jgi:HK97 family phage portal protein
MVMYQNVSNGYRKKDSYNDFADEGYQQNAVVYRCVNEISNGAASVSFKLFSGDTELENHPLISLLGRPNPLMAGVEYFQCLYSHLIISGNAYAVRSIVNGIPRELHLLRPDRVRIVPSKTNIPARYEYVINGRVVETYDVDPDTGLSDVKHFKMFNPLDDYLGMSPVKAASLDIDQHNLAASHNVSLLNNGARPSGAIVFNPKDESGASIQLTDGQRQQLLGDLESRFTGSNNSGRAMLLEGDFDWKEMGLSPKDMDFLQLKNMSARDIALCFGVPAQLVGVPDSQTYNNIAEARLALYEETIIPLMKRVESDFNEWLAPMFDGEELAIGYDYDNIPAMAERRRMIYDNVIAAVREGIISRNEARERLDLSPVEGGDDVYISANLFPLGSPEISPQEQEVDPEDAEKGAYGVNMGKMESKKISPKEEIRKDVFNSEQEAQQRAEEIGCVGYHAHDEDGDMVYMPCKTHEEYTRLTGEDVKDEDAKAESDIDTVPTEEMASNAERGLKLRKEYNRGGTEVGVARAVQLINRERLSPRTVRRMHSFFSRHEVDKRAEGFRQGENGYPSAGKIANLLWGGDSGQTWARRKVSQLDRERDESKQICELFTEGDIEAKADISEKMKKALANKVKEHNDKHGDKKGKRVTQRMLEAVFRRGVGAYNTNPESVRPTVSSPDQWALARVNVFLQAVRTGKFKRGKFDRDLLPKDHPLRSE